ncbi:hypothetical protein AAL_03591 [Moelleriella libera RCEF 2490]|uniref:Protein ECM13 n=1 Tax=Moelleriella libera RCEF 2490 TaxID=1081109 RepID=A0A168DDM6_9HYPO|nr:hypothetical protein AAL_03591 [Moelleriella libera RCEF 2490]
MSAATAVQSYRPTTSATSFNRIRSAPKKDMSITQTYYLAHKARAKLSREAAQPDHDLRLLVGHANLLDSLMLELADAEREQERWFNQSVRGASSKKTTSSSDRRVQWADKIVEQPEEEYDSESSDSDSDLDEQDIAMINTPPSVRSATITEQEVDEEEMGDDLEEDYAHLELVRTPSHSSSPPELLIDHDSESSDDESMPPSPSDASLEFSEKEAKSQNPESFRNEYYSRRTPTGLVTAISVY